MKYCRETSLEEQIRIAAGEEPAGLVLKGGHVFNVFTREWEDVDVAISGNKVVGLGSYRGKEEIDVTGKYLTPGFIDAHVHLESSMLAPREMVKILLLNGVTGVVTDPHEIANVMGAEGIRFFLKETEDMPFSVYMMLPSCVPATSMENAGAALSAADMAELKDENDRVLGLGEMMDVPGVLFRTPEAMAKMALFCDRVIDGHAPGLTGQSLNAYITAGVHTDHECVTAEEAREKLRRGMYVLLREGSAAHNLVDLLPVVNEDTCRRCCLCTDDRHADDLISEGSINYLLEIGVTQGCPAELLIPMASLNTAECYGLKDTGAIAPGYFADINVFDSLAGFQPVHVIKKGLPIVRNRQLQWESVSVLEPVASSMNMPEMTPESFAFPGEAGRKMHVIGICREQLLTEDLLLEPKVVNGQVVSDTENDILKMAVCERHHNTGNIGLGFVHGFNLKKGAVASTVAHDSHNLIVLGTNDEDMAVAANRLRAVGGGLVIVADGEVRSTVPLPIAGLMSDKEGAAVNAQLKQLHFWAAELGLPEDFNVFMTLSFLALPVIPTLRLTDKGLVDVNRFQLISPWAE